MNKKFVLVFRTKLVGEIPCPYELKHCQTFDMGVKKAHAMLVEHHSEKAAWNVVFRYFPDYTTLQTYNEDFFKARSKEISLETALTYINQ